MVTDNSKVVIVQDSMRRELKDEAIRIAVDGLVKQKEDLNSVCKKLRDTFDQNYGKYWQCIFSRDTLEEHTWYKTHYLGFKVGEANIILFRAAASILDFDDRKVDVSYEDGMTTAMKDLAIDTAVKAIDNCDNLRDIASRIKDAFEAKHGKYWHCFLGPDFRWRYTYLNYHMSFSIGNVCFVLFK